MLDPEKFREMFHPTWWAKVKPWFETEEAFKVYEYLKQRSATSKVLPESNYTFRAFKSSGFGQLKAIIVGLSPYHTIGENLRADADGLAFSCSFTNRECPSLKLFYDAMEHDLGKTLNRNSSLQYLSEQGVLLTNYSLTTELKKSTIHADAGLWNGWNRFLYTTVLGSRCDVPIVLCGKQAQSIEKYLFPMCHSIKCVEHPAAAARDHRSWNHDNCFNWINQTITEKRNEYSAVEWDELVYNDTPW